MAGQRTRTSGKRAAEPEGWALYYRVVRRVPHGRVTTYGAIAALAGNPRAARHVGFALAALRGTNHRVPWQRVMGARGRGFAAVTIRDPIGGTVQRELLEQEGVAFDALGRVDLARFGWGIASKRGPKATPRARARATPRATRRR